MFRDAQSSTSADSLRTYLECIRKDAPFYTFVAAYAAVGLAIGAGMGVPHKFAPLSYVYYTLFVAICTTIIAGGFWAVWSRQPYATLKGAAGKAVHPSTVAAATLFVALCIHMGVFTSIKTMLPDISPFHADHALADLDEILHGGAPSRYITELLPATTIPVISFVYVGIWSLLLPTGLLAILFVPGLRAVRDQYLWTHLLIWPLLGNLAAGTAMSAGPIFYGLVTGDRGRFAALDSYLAQFPPLREGAAYLWESYMSGQLAFSGGISAFPSMHLANATLLVLLAARGGTTLKWMAVAFCAFTLLGSVQLGWHYAVDGYFSIVATVLIWVGVGGVVNHLALTAARRRPELTTDSMRKAR